MSETDNGSQPPESQTPAVSNTLFSTIRPVLAPTQENPQAEGVKLDVPQPLLDGSLPTG